MKYLEALLYVYGILTIALALSEGIRCYRRRESTAIWLFRMLTAPLAVIVGLCAVFAEIAMDGLNSLEAKLR